MNKDIKRIVKKGILKSVKTIAKTLVSKKYRAYIRACRIMSGKVTFKELLSGFKPFRDEFPGTSLSARLYRQMFL
ncbi:pyruvate formate lyase, partial [Bacteroides sartorii]|nr:pyruvate formate lyase [Phocaeicola sartorii]